MSFRQFSSVIFDFSGTLCSDLYFRPLGPAFLAGVDRLIFGQDKTVADKWMRGDWCARQVCEWLSPQLKVDPRVIESALRQGCHELAFNQDVLNFATKLRREGTKTALVTINADVFTEVVIPAHGLSATFDVIVNSAERRESDKGKLSADAFTLLGPDIGYHNSLLIDDNEKYVAVFRDSGGTAFRYRADVGLPEWTAAKY